MNNLLEKTTEISLSKTLLLFYLVSASGFLGDLFSKDLKAFFNTKPGQHILGLVVLMAVIIEYSGVTDVYKILLYTLLGYVWFLFTTKMNIKWNLIVIALLFVGFLYEARLNKKEKDASQDQALDQDNINNIKNKNNKLKNIIILSIGVVTLIGGFSFYTEKKVQYGGDFNIDKYLFQ